MGKKGKLDYKWVIAAACFVLCVVGLGLCSGNAGLFVVATTEALGISRSAYAVSSSLRYVSTAVMNMFFGMLALKFGTRKLIGAGMLALVLSCVANALATNVIGLYIGGVLLGVGLTFAGTTIIGYVIRQWFAEHQGVVLGVVLSANALGAAVSAPWFSSVIYGGEVFGYRKVYWVVAGILLVSGIVLVLLFRDVPKEDKKRPVAGKQLEKSRAWKGNAYADRAVKPYFYIICACLILTGMVLASSAGVSAAHMKDQGVDPTYVALVTSVYSLMLAASKFLIGAVSDKKGLRFAVLTCDGAALIMVVLLCVVSGSAMGKVIAMTYAVFAGLALPLQTVLLPLMAGDMFRNEDYSKVLGIFTAANSIGFLLGNTLANFCFDLFGTYRHILITDGILMVAISAGFVFAYQKLTASRKITKV